MIYVHPSQTVVDQVSPSGVRLLTSDMVKQGFQQFRERLALAMEQNSALRCADINNRMFLVSHDCAALCMPFHKYALYLYRSESSVVSFATGTIPVSGFHSTEETPALSYPILALDEPIRGCLEMAVERAVHKLKSEITNQPELSNSITDILHIINGL